MTQGICSSCGGLTTEGEKWFGEDGPYHPWCERKELKPCPFCGSAASKPKWPVNCQRADDLFAIHCTALSCTAQVAANSEAEVIAMWNRRP